MYLGAHIGLGYLAVKPWRRQWPTLPLLLGTILPDLIDKPIFYTYRFLHPDRPSNLIAGTRLFAHTAIFAAICFLLAWRTKSRTVWALATGVLTHLLLDEIGDGVKALQASHTWPYDLGLYLWPAYGWGFPAFPYQNVNEQFGRWLDPTYLILEALGLCALILCMRILDRRGANV